MSRPTATEWKELEKSIGLYASRKLRIDGHTISSYLVKSGMNLRYEVFINGKWELKHTDRESNLGKKYLCPMRIRKYKKSFLKAMEKVYGKRRFKKEFPNPNEIVTIGYTPFFKSFRTMKKTWLDNNESIEILPVEQ